MTLRHRSELIETPYDFSKYITYLNSKKDEAALAEMEQTVVEVYGSDGAFYGRFDNLKAAQSVLTRGVYLVRNNTKTVKITVK